MEGFTDKLRDKLRCPSIDILRRKNPFLFRVRSGDDAHELSKMVIDAYLSSSEETIFGNILEEIAISVCAKAKEGARSSAEGIDLEYGNDTERTLIQIKSGPNWGNSSQRKKLNDYFNSARKRLGASGISARCVEGICYGRRQEKHYGSHMALIGTAFWEDISNWDETHFAICDRLGVHAGNGLNEPKDSARDKMVNFLRQNGAAHDNEVDWQRLFGLLF